MQLLGTSAAIAFDRTYPCEDRVLSSLLHLAQPIAGQPPIPAGWWMDDPDRLWWMDPAWLGDVRSAHDPLPDLDAPGRDVLHRRVVRALWSAYTQTERENRGPGVRYYAEKYGAYAEVLASSGIPVLFVDLIRDPRDIWLSVRAFDQKRNSYGFGRREGQSEEDYLRSFLRSIRRRLDVMAAAEGDVNVRQIRYEQLIAELDAQADRLSQWLGVPLQPAAVRQAEDRFRHHMTSASASASVERWRTELSMAELSAFDKVLSDHLVRLGYPAGDRMVVAEP